MQTLFAFLAALTLLVFVHELGHYLVAVWCDVKVLKFSIGFGKPIVSKKWGKDQTEWTLAMIPLGGFVKMLDEREQETASIPAQDLPRAFSQKSLFQRSLIVVAGPVANLLLAIFLYAMMGWIGIEEAAPIVDQPAKSSAADVAQLQRGDRILAIDGQQVRSWNDLRLKLLTPVIEKRTAEVLVKRASGEVQLKINAGGLPEDEAERNYLQTLGIELAPGKVEVGTLSPGGAAERDGLKSGDVIVQAGEQKIERARTVIDQIRANPEVPVAIKVLRGKDEITLNIKPEAKDSEKPEEAGRKIGRIGAALVDKITFDTVQYGPLEGIAQGIKQTWEMSIFSVKMMGKMVTGDLSLKNLSGPVTIADLAGKTVRVGWYAYVSFLALISISLAVLNLMPIPVLDGGHLVYYGLEALKGKPLSERFMEWTQKAGLALIMMMMAVALFNDFSRLLGS
jgi:regulator of sigma E protease